MDLDKWSQYCRPDWRLRYSRRSCYHKCSRRTDWPRQLDRCQGQLVAPRWLWGQFDRNQWLSEGPVGVHPVREALDLGDWSQYCQPNWRLRHTRRSRHIEYSRSTIWRSELDRWQGQSRSEERHVGK